MESQPPQLVPIPPISKLRASERQQLLDDLNYLNTAEIKAFCKQHKIPYMISIASADGRQRRTSEMDRKGIVLNRIRHFLSTGEILDETCFPAAVVASDATPAKPTASNRLFYGHYDKKSAPMIALLKELTGGKFQSGAIARILAREFWSRGIAPTFKEYASAWLQAQQEHERPNPEWAFLSDLARGTAAPDWKKLRAKKAARVLARLKKIKWQLAIGRGQE